MLRNCGICLCALLTCGLGLTLLQLDPQAVRQFGQNLEQLLQYPDTMAREHDRAERLECSHCRTVGHMEAKQALASQVLAGTVSLREAAVRFEQLSTGSPYPWDYLADEHPEWSVEVRCGHYVIDAVQYELANNRRLRANGTLARLQAEVAAWEHAGTDGAVQP
jgi:hypothetical protein